MRLSAIVLSAALLNSIFLFPQSSILFSFIFLLPLFYVDFFYSLTFRYGFLWGIIFFLFNLYPLIEIILYKGEGEIRYFCAIIFLLYFAFHTGVWFLCVHTLKKYCTNDYFYLAGQVLCTLGYFVWLSSYALWPFGLKTGYPFALPLVPMAYYPWLIFSLTLIDKFWLMFCLIVFQSMLSQWFITYNSFFLWLALLALTPFYIFYPFFHYSSMRPTWLNTIAYIKPSSATQNNFDLAEEINAAIIRSINNNPEIKYIVMPETVFHIPLNVYPEIIHILSSNHEVQLLIGGARQECENNFNSLYNIYKGRIIFFYDKTLCVPFIESFSWPFTKLPCLETLFLKKKKKFTNANQTLFSFPVDSQIFCPIICSEFFFSHSIKTSNNSLFLVMNESWFGWQWYKNLMHLYVITYALENRVSILAIGYEGATWIDTSNGYNYFPLNSYSQ